MEEENKTNISKEDIVKKYVEDNNSEPSWKDKKQKEMTKEEKNEYKKYRKRFEKTDKEKEPEEFYSKDENNLTEEEKEKLRIYTQNKLMKATLSNEDREELEKTEKIDRFIEKYIIYRKISTQLQLNYAIEHDEKFRIYLEKVGRMDSLYTGEHLENIKREKQRIDEELKTEAKKDKRRRITKNPKNKKRISNVLKESKKELDLTPYRNKKLEKQGSILTLYLRKNGWAEFRYVNMDEVGQIKVDGYVYHEKDAVYRIGKKNYPLLIIIEGSLVPINKEMLRDNLGCQSAEAQKLIIKGIEQAEVVKSSGIDGNAKKPLAPPKWAIAVGIAVIIGIYAFMGGFK